jgi:hypothetical protein
LLVLNVFGRYRVDGREPSEGERHERAASVAGVGVASDEAARLEAVETLCRTAT